MDELRVLQELGEQFRRIEPPAPRRAPLRGSRALVFAALLVLLLAGVAAAAILISSGAPLPAAHVQDLQAGGVPLASSARLAGLDAADPDGSDPPWDIRLSRTADGETCTAVGQVFDGRFGIVGLDHVFRPLPLGGVDTCGVDSPDGPVLAGARVFAGATAGEARTVVNGVAGSGTRSVTAYGPGPARSLKLGPEGSFVTAYAGYVEEVRPRIVIVGRDGHSHEVAFASSQAFETPDPEGGSPWQVSGGARLGASSYPEENCAQVTRALGPADPSFVTASLTPEVCGRLGQNPLFVLMRRFVPGSGEGSGYPWGDNPARTLVYGAAGQGVKSLILTGAGAPRALPIDPRGGAFIAVLDGHVDPRALTLTATLGSGHTVSYRRSSNVLDARSNRPLAETPVPAFREPAAVKATRPPPFQLPIASTVRETLRASDPSAALTWAARSWQGRPNPQSNGGRLSSERFICLQVGVLHGGQLQAYTLGGPAVPLRAGQESFLSVGGCTQPSLVLKRGDLLNVESYLAEPYEYDARPARSVVSGLLPPGSSDAVLLEAGPPRKLTLDANGAFLTVLPGRYWDAPVRLRYRLHGRIVGERRRGPVPVPRIPQARAPDPDGGAAWGFTAGPHCSEAIGRIVDGHLASIDERFGMLSNEASITGGGGNCATRANGTHRQVFLDIQPTDEISLLPGETKPALTRPEIERRTLPGRTVIVGVAEADVSSVTLSTPRDVRTLRPSGPYHALIAVYDGEFFRGVITATIRLRNGHTITETIPGGPGTGGTPPQLTPRGLYRDFAHQIALLRSGRPGYLEEGASSSHLSPARRAAIRRAQIASYEKELAALRRRFDYERAHPGVLPRE